MTYSATSKDLPELLRMTKAFFDASPYNQSEYSVEKIQSSLIIGMENPNFLVLLLGETNKNFGMLIGFISTNLFNNDRVAAELIWWIDPDHRDAKNGTLLHASFQDWAINNGCKIVTMVALEDENIDKISKMYNKFGYRPVERSFKKEIN